MSLDLFLAKLQGRAVPSLSLSSFFFTSHSFQNLNSSHPKSPVGRSEKDGVLWRFFPGSPFWKVAIPSSLGKCQRSWIETEIRSHPPVAPNPPMASHYHKKKKILTLPPWLCFHDFLSCSFVLSGMWFSQTMSQLFTFHGYLPIRCSLTPYTQ